MYILCSAMANCPICKQSYAHNPACGLRLFNSENECAICLENKPTMLALPCGHQFCQEDLERIGIRPMVAAPQPEPPQRTVRLSRAMFLARQRVRQNHMARERRRPPRLPIISVHRRRRRHRRRCGWCGHFGHTIRKCTEHKLQCKCVSFKRARHKRLYSRKHRCVSCGKKGHRPTTCTDIVRGR